MKLTLALLTAIGGAQADPILFSIGADGLGVPRQLFQIDVGAANVTPLALLGDGSLSYGGGLAYRTGSTFDGLETDSFGSVNRVSYTSAGAVSNIAAAGSFSGGGMANVGGTVRAPWQPEHAIAPGGGGSAASNASMPSTCQPPNGRIRRG